MNKTSYLILASMLMQLYTHSNTIESNYDIVRNLKVNPEQLQTLTELELSHMPPKTRPEFCPLNNTASYKKTAESLKALVAVFQDDCFDNNQSLVGQLLESSQSLENELNTLAEQQGKPANTPQVQTLDEIEVDGIPVAQIMNGMNTLFSSNKCTNLDRQSFLERSADVIQTFSQIGLYSDDGAKYAFGGLAVSSILRFINSIFEKRFEFENEADIQTFVKLNCSYYDLRNEIKKLEVFSIDTSKHHRDKITSKELLDQLKLTKEAYNKALEELDKEISEKEEKYISTIAKDLEKIITPISNALPATIADQPGKNATYQQAEVLGLLTFNLDLLQNALTEYIAESNGPEMFLNILFKQKLDMLLNAGELMTLTPKEFNNTFYHDLVSSFNRVLRDIEKQRAEGKKKFQDEVLISDNDSSLTVSQIKEYLASKDRIDTEEEFNTYFKRTNTIDSRLERFVNRNEYTSKDSSNGGTREIVKSLDIAKNYIYGSFGKNFLEAMKDRSSSQNKNFIDQFVDIQNNYTDRSGKYLKIIPKDQLNEDQIRNACVDVQTAREVWVYSQSLSELGYDFLSTNSDIFGNADKVKDRIIIKKHDDSTNLARRIITALNYKKKYENYSSLGKQIIEVYGQSLPINEALELINTIEFYGQTFTIDEAKKYLYEEFGSSLSLYNYLGPVILDIAMNKPRAIFLQNIYEEYSCDTATTLNK